MRPAGGGKAFALSYDGSEGNYYTMRSVTWSPDGKRLAAYRVRPGYRREVHYVESSPADQLQPKHFTIPYRKPGDALDFQTPVLFQIAAKKQIVPPDLLEEVFELNMQLEELRMAKKLGEDDPGLAKEIAGHKVALEGKHDALLQELQKYWADWDSLIERNHGSRAPAEERANITAKMVDVLNRRNYLRNLLRDVNAALES